MTYITIHPHKPYSDDNIKEFQSNDNDPIFSYKWKLSTGLTTRFDEWPLHTFTQHMSRVSCQKGPTRHAYAWQIGPFWQDTLDVCNTQPLNFQD